MRPVLCMCSTELNGYFFININRNTSDVFKKNPNLKRNRQNNLAQPDVILFSCMYKSFEMLKYKNNSVRHNTNFSMEIMKHISFVRFAHIESRKSV